MLQVACFDMLLPHNHYVIRMQVLAQRALCRGHQPCASQHPGLLPVLWDVSRCLAACTMAEQMLAAAVAHLHHTHRTIAQIAFQVKTDISLVRPCLMHI